MVEIRDEPISFDLHGVSGAVLGRNYAQTGFKLMEGLWPVIKQNGIKTTGINYWVYAGCDRMSTCVELADKSVESSFEHIPVHFGRYAYYKHVGPYDRLSEAYKALDKEIERQDLTRSGGSVEKYGDWTDDASQLVTEIFIGLN